MIRTYATIVPAPPPSVAPCLVPSHPSRKRPREEPSTSSIHCPQIKSRRKAGGAPRGDPSEQPHGAAPLPPTHPSLSRPSRKRCCASESTSGRAAKTRHLGPSSVLVSNRVSSRELAACSQAAARGRAAFSSDSSVTRASGSRLSASTRSRSPLGLSTASSSSSSTESSLHAFSLSSRAPARPGRPPGRPPGR
jgi:hypothetical protein